MRCPNCGFEGEGKFCAQCGAPLEEMSIVHSDGPVIPADETRSVRSDDPVIPADEARSAVGPAPEAEVPPEPSYVPHSGAAFYGGPPKKQGIGAKFGAFWHKNKRNKVLVIIAALILISIVRSLVGGIGSPDMDTQESYEPPNNEMTETVSGSEEKDAIEEPEATEEPEREPAAEKKEKKSSGVDPDFKETMDEYEAFMNDYVDFMKKYENSDDTASMMVDYGKMMAQYAEFTEKIDNIDEDELSDADYAYYMKVTGRVTEKMAELY